MTWLPTIILSLVIILLVGLGFVALQRQMKGRLSDAQSQVQQLALQLDSKTQAVQELEGQKSQDQTDLALAKAAHESAVVQTSEHKVQLLEANSRLEQSRKQASDLQAQLERSQTLLQERNQDGQKLEQKEQQVDALNLQIAQLNTRLNQEQVERQKDQENLQEKLELLQNNKAQLSQEFENLSNKIFEEKTNNSNKPVKKGLTAC